MLEKIFAERVIYRRSEVRRKRASGFGVFLLIVGILWLLSELGYIPSLPFWPIVIILFALYLIFG